MPRVRVTENLGDWIAKLDGAAARAPSDLARAVEANAKDGRDAAKTFARGKSGAHGQHYYKRIGAEPLAPLVWEYGPSPLLGSNYVGAGFRHRVNRDLARSADIVGPALARDAQRLAARWLS